MTGLAVPGDGSVSMGDFRRLIGMQMPSHGPITGKTSAELREQCMRLRFVPLAQRVFDRFPEVRRVIYAVAQYCDDEAEDAVQERIEADAGDAAADDAAAPSGGDPSGTTSGARLPSDDRRRLGIPSSDDVWGLAADLPDLDANGSRITAFASYCPEEGRARFNFAATICPYAIARRGADGRPALEIVGVIVRPEWEDRFDVGHDAEPVRRAREELAAKAAPPRAERPARRGLLGLLRRLWGGRDVGRHS